MNFTAVIHKHLIIPTTIMRIYTCIIITEMVIDTHQNGLMIKEQETIEEVITTDDRRIRNFIKISVNYLLSKLF